MSYHKKKDNYAEIALKRIDDLFLAAENLFSDKEFADLSSENKHKYANRYVELARKISTKHNITIPSKYRKLYCKHCYSYLRQGDNVRVRLNDGKLVYYCLSCKKFARQPLHSKSSSE